MILSFPDSGIDFVRNDHIYLYKIFLWTTPECYSTYIPMRPWKQAELFHRQTQDYCETQDKTDKHNIIEKNKTRQTNTRLSRGTF